MAEEHTYLDYKEFTSRFRALLKSRGVTKHELSDAVGIARQTLTRYAAGIGEPSLVYVAAIARYFRVSIDWILGIDYPGTLAEDAKDIIDLYSLASESDREYIRQILWKYRGELKKQREALPELD